MLSRYASSVFLLLTVSLSVSLQGLGTTAHDGSFSIDIQESAGIYRRGEPTQVSLPFAAGALESQEGIEITDAAGVAIPAQYEVLARWDDGSIRWLLARFVVDIPAHEDILLTVRSCSDSTTIPEENLVRERAGGLQVDTGAIRAELGLDHRESFWITDREGVELLAERPELIVYSPMGQEHRCGPPQTVEVEVNGPLYASVFVAGPMQSGDARFANLFRYETRLHFWRGSPCVLAEQTVIAAGDDRDGIVVVDGIVLGFESAHEFSECVFAGEDETYAALLRDGEQLRLKQDCAYWHECTRGPDSEIEPVKYVVLESDFGFDVSSASGKPVFEGEKSAGWLWAGDSERSIGVAVRDFWEEGPKALEIGADGSLTVECYARWRSQPGESRPQRVRTPDYSKDPRLDAWAAAINEDAEKGMRLWLEESQYPGPVRRGPFRFGWGRAKTTDVFYLFGRTENREEQIETLAAQRYPLIPVVDAGYLASTKALPFVELAACDSALPVFEEGLLAMFENWKKHATRYGYLHFGDDQCAWGYNRTVPSTTDDQEYDTVQCLTMQFGRTGIAEYLRWANICARHFLDVDQTHPDGLLRYHGYDASGDYHEEGLSIDMGGHPYIGGIVNHFMLTGDRRSLRGIQRLARALEKYGENAQELVMTTDGRSLSRAGICLAAIYDLTRDPKHLAPVKRMVDAINDLADCTPNELRGQPPYRMWWFNHSEMSYHIRELLVRYHAATGDARTLRILEKSLDTYIDDLWDSEHEAWRGWLGAPHDFNMPYEHPVARKGRSMYTQTGYAAAEKGISFAYMARASGNNEYLVPFLDHLGDLGSEYAKHYGNRQFARRQLWSLPFVSMLPTNWRNDRDRIVQREVFRASLKESDELSARTPTGSVKGSIHGEALWKESRFGRVLRTYGSSHVSFPAPEDILRKPGTVSFWVRKDEAHWDRKPWPWYGELRGLLYIGSDARETNALDLMMLKENLWVRLYDDRAWEMVAIESATPGWASGQWQHIAVVWNRFDLTLYINGQQAGHDDRFSLPNGGQTTIHLGWRPTNRYGQADYHDLRLFRAALPASRVQRIYEESLSTPRTP